MRLAEGLTHPALLRVMIIAVCFACPVSLHAQAESVPGDSILLWGHPEIVTPVRVDTGGFRWSAPCFSRPDGQRFCGATATVLFDSLRVHLHKKEDPLAAARTWTIRVPYEVLTRASRLTLKQTVRFYVAKPANAHVVLLFDGGGQAALYDFPRGRAVEGQELRRTITRSVPNAVRAQTMSVMLFVERDSPDAVVLVDVDSIDLGLSPAARPGTSPSREK